METIGGVEHGLAVLQEHLVVLATLYYVQDACLPVRKLWAEEFCDRMSPERFFDTLVTGRIPVGLPAFVINKLQPPLDDVRGRIETPYGEAWGRSPDLTEWLAILYRTGIPLNLPDGNREKNRLFS